MDFLSFHTQEIPSMANDGARFVVVAYNNTWRDGEATNDRSRIPHLKRELQKRYMNRLNCVA